MPSRRALSRLLLVVLGAVTVGLVLSALARPSDVACGPVRGTLLAADEAAIGARISVQDARAAALVAVPGATVTDADLDEEDGFLVYEVELNHHRDAFDVVVDAGTGDVLCTERD